MGNIFGDLVKTITRPIKGVAKAAAPLSPFVKLLGPSGAMIGTGLDVLNNLSSQEDYRNRADQMAEEQRNLYLNNPYLQALQAEILNPSAFGYRQALESASSAARGAADSYQMQLAGRGLGMNSSALSGGLGQIYSSVPAAAGQAYGQYLQQRPSMLAQAAGLSIGAAPGLGGVGNYYASRQNEEAQALAGSIPVIGEDLSRAGDKVSEWFMRQTGIGKRRPASAGDNALGTNQSGVGLGRTDIWANPRGPSLGNTSTVPWDETPPASVAPLVNTFNPFAGSRVRTRY